MLVVATALLALSALHTDPCPAKFESDQIYEAYCVLPESRDMINGCLELGTEYSMVGDRCVGPITVDQCAYDIGGKYEAVLCEDALETTAPINYTQLVTRCCEAHRTADY